MRAITYTSQSHLPMCQRFVIDRFELSGFSEYEVIETAQLCLTGDYASVGFNEQMRDKLRVLTTFPLGTSILYVDADCILFPGLSDWCEEHITRTSIMYGDDIVQFCMGTMLFRQTVNTRTWFEFLIQLSWALDANDQDALNYLVTTNKKLLVPAEKLPKDIFSNCVHDNIDLPVWDGIQPFTVPDTCLCWHANYCIGVENKIKMLDLVEKEHTRCLIASSSNPI